MNDEEWKKEVQQMRTTSEILKEILEAVDQGMFGHDPYYADLKTFLVKKARKILADRTHKPYPETHQKGMILIENCDYHKIGGDTHIQGDLGVQIARDGRVWLCINGVAFIRFSPHPDGKMRKEQS